MLKTDVLGQAAEYPDIDDPFFIDLYPKFKEYTMTTAMGAEAPWALFKSIEHIVKHGIPGDIVECGVWRGGSMFLAAKALIHFGDTSRRLYLYDTFAGMPRPEDVDRGWDGTPALPVWEKHVAAGKLWGFGGTVDMVRQVMVESEYPMEKVLFVQGLVEETLPLHRPDRIGLLRLDTDFYKSTLHELVHLYPLLSSNGILIIDDYGYFAGARDATEQYIAENSLKIFLSRVNFSVRLAIKP